MQIIDLNLSHWNFHCPVTGQKIQSDGEDTQFPPSLKGLWIGEIADNPEIKDPTLQAAWDNFIENFNDESFLEPEDINGFLANYTAPNWLAFYICSGTAAFNDSAWYIIDMDTQSK